MTYQEMQVNTQAKQILIAWINRDLTAMGTTNQVEIADEVDRILNAYDENHYLRTSRKGSTVPLNRKMKRGLWQLYQNAKKHACYSQLVKSGYFNKKSVDN